MFNKVSVAECFYSEYHCPLSILYGICNNFMMLDGEHTRTHTHNFIRFCVGLFGIETMRKTSWAIPPSTCIIFTGVHKNDEINIDVSRAFLLYYTSAVILIKFDSHNRKYSGNVRKKRRLFNKSEVCAAPHYLCLEIGFAINWLRNCLGNSPEWLWFEVSNTFFCKPHGHKHN